MIYWIYTETGHGKGLMDGVGSAMKTTIDSIAYNPNVIIRNTEELLPYLPDVC